MPEPVEDFLAHYGVRGMKWGKRKAAPSRSIEQFIERDQKIRKVNTLLKDDLYPKRQAALRFLNDSKGPLIALGAGTVTLIGMSIASRNSGAAAAAKILADSKGLPVAGLVKMTYNATSGTWR